MGIIGDKLQQKIENNNNIRYSDTIAEITYYDNIKNTASIRFANPNNGSVMTATNIAVKINMGGLSQAALKIGQKCWISFIGNNLLCPVITNLCDDQYYDNVYSKKTNADQGAYLVDNEINDIDIDSVEVSPMTDDYFNDSTSTKYSLITKDYTDTQAVQEVRKILMEIDKYKTSEDGITNMKSNSTVKFKDNGDIDIFIDNNTGIRISNGKIYFYGRNIIFNGTEITNIINNTTINNTGNDSQSITTDDIIYINKIGAIIQSTDTSELEEIIRLLIEINGENNKLNSLKKDIEEFKTIKEQYLNNSITNIQETYERAKYLSELFTTELEEANKVVIE